MKSRKGIIALIVVLSILTLLLIGFLIIGIKGKFSHINFKYGKVSNELVLDEEYDINFEDIIINSDASKINILLSNDDKYKVVIHGEKVNTKVETNDNKLRIVSKMKNCKGFCFFRKISQIDVYVPRDYEKNISINNDYGDITIDELANSNINIDIDAGDIDLKAVNDLTIKNDYGDIKIDNAKTAKIDQSSGDIEIGTVDDIDIDVDYGDVEINNINNYVKIDNSCGDITINNLHINKNSSIKDNLGDIKIGRTNEIDIDASTDLGKVKINNDFNDSDIKLNIENDCGDITINN